MGISIKMGVSHSPAYFKNNSDNPKISVWRYLPVDGCQRKDRLILKDLALDGRQGDLMEDLLTIPIKEIKRPITISQNLMNSIGFQHQAEINPRYSMRRDILLKNYFIGGKSWKLDFKIKAC
jgi:hypothetical protein